MIIGIVGCGVVGSTLKRWVDKNTDHTVRCVDPGLGMNDDLAQAKALFVSIPVPTAGNRRQYTLDLQMIVRKYSGMPWRPIFIRSTVLPGTCDKLADLYGQKVYAMPEFLTERTADADFASQTVLAGCVADESSKDILRSVFGSKAVVFTTNKEAEIAKYAHNCFGAIKVNYFNIVRHLAEAHQCDYQQILKGIGISGYIDPTHTRVPGPDGKYGYGGKCFPKDLQAFIGYLTEHGMIGASSLLGTEAENLYFREKERG